MVLSRQLRSWKPRNVQYEMHEDLLFIVHMLECINLPNSGLFCPVRVVLFLPSAHSSAFATLTAVLPAVLPSQT